MKLSAAAEWLGLTAAGPGARYRVEDAAGDLYIAFEAMSGDGVRLTLQSNRPGESVILVRQNDS